MEEEIKKENIDKQGGEQRRRLDWLKEYQWQKGQSGNPKGRPKGKTMKEWCREFLMNMSEASRLAFIESIDGKEVWKMAEGNPHQDTKLDANVSMPFIIKLVKDDGSTTTRDSN